MNNEAANVGNDDGSRTSAALAGSTEVAGDTAERAKDVVGAAAHQAADVVGQAKAQLLDLTSQSRTEVMSQLDTQGARVAGGLNTWSTQLAAFADGRVADAGPLPHYARDAEQRVQRLAGRLEQGGAQGVLDDVTAFARRRPAMFLAGAAALGFVVARVVRAGAAAASDGDVAGSAGRAPMASFQPPPTPIASAPVAVGEPLAGMSTR